MFRHAQCVERAVDTISQHVTYGACRGRVYLKYTHIPRMHMCECVTGDKCRLPTADAIQQLRFYWNFYTYLYIVCCGRSYDAVAMHILVVHREHTKQNMTIIFISRRMKHTNTVSCVIHGDVQSVQIADVLTRILSLIFSSHALRINDERQGARSTTSITHFSVSLALYLHLRRNIRQVSGRCKPCSKRFPAKIQRCPKCSRSPNTA